VFQLLTKKEKWSFFVGLILVLLSILLELFSMSLIVPVLALLNDSSVSQSDSRILNLLNGVGIELAAILMMASVSVIFILKNALQVYMVWFQQRFTSNLDIRLGSELFRIYMRRRYADHLLSNSSLMIRNVQAVSLISSGYLVPVMNLISDLTTSVGIFALLLFLEPLGTSVALLFFGATGFLFQKSTKQRIIQWGEDRLRHGTEALKFLQYGFGGMKDVKVLGREDHFKSSYEAEFTQSMRLESKFNTISALPKGFLEVISIVGLSILIVLMILSDRPFSEVVPIVGLFAAASFRVVPAVTRIVSNLGILRYSSGSILTFSKDFSVPEDEGINESKCEFNRSIRFQEVQFAYNNSNRRTLTNISFEIHNGESVGFIGESGAGKSTLIDLIIGLLKPTSGEIYLDDVSVNLSCRNWMDQIGYVPQNIFLTDDTIMNNVAFGINPAMIDRGRVNDVIAFSQLTDFVAALPHGLETIVGERGARISGGERQRIGIARALYRNPKIIVFDEATSSLDNDTELGIVDLIKDIGSRCTVISVAHRFSTLKNCNRIFKIENGSITQEGTFEEIIGE
jgi:ABC-type bacteriocin/lantibiotic exporter with double-glycine peptidase domain